jgi:hypothetical protein
MVTFTATLGSTSQTDKMTVSPLLDGVSVSLPSVTGGTAATLLVTLNAAAPSGGITVALSSTVPTAAQIPASIFVPAGATSVQATVRTYRVPASTAVMLKATYASCTRVAALNVD